MRRKVAIPVSGGKLSAHFGHSEHFVIYEVEGKEVLSQNKEVPPPHEQGVLPRWLHALGATDIIAGGIGHKAISIFNGNHINVLVGAPSIEPDEIIRGFLNDTLQLQGNYCDH